MKIAINTRFLLKNKLEGIGRFSYEIIKRLVQDHPEDEFIFFFDRPYDSSFIFGNNVTPVVLSPPARHPFLWYWWFEISVYRALKKYQVDLFFSPDNYLSLKSDIKTLMVCHDIVHVHYPMQIPYLVRQYYQHFVPKYLRRANRIITVSEFVKKDIAQQYQIDKNNIDVCYNACRVGFKPIDEGAKAIIKDKHSDGQDYLFYVGAIHPRKNLTRVIKAFDRYKVQKGNSIKLLLGGRLAWQTADVKNAVNQSNYKSDIHFLGFIPDEDLPNLMAAATAFVYVSLSEGFGIPILEAMHCDVPVISSNTSSLPEVAGDAALLVDPLSVEAISEAFSSILHNAELRKRLIKNGRVQRQLFSWDQSASKVYESIKKTMQS